MQTDGVAVPAAGRVVSQRIVPVSFSYALKQAEGNQAAHAGIVPPGGPTGAGAEWTANRV
jgi:hypothetical protein